MASPTAPSLVIVPSFDQVLKLARYQLRDYLRSRRFLLMLGLTGVIGLLLTAVVGYYRPSGIVSDPLSFYARLWGGGVTYVIVFAAVIFGGDAIAGEFQNRTGYFLMGLPVRRSVIYAGKYLAALAAAFASLIVFFVILLANAAFYFGTSALPWQMGPSFALATIYLFAVLGTTFLFSSMFKTSTYATLVVAVLFLFGFPLLADLIQGLAHVTPWFIISFASGPIGEVLSNTCATQPGPHTCQGDGGFTFMVNNPTIFEGLAIMLSYFVITAILGLLLFDREEFA